MPATHSGPDVRTCDPTELTAAEAAIEELATYARAQGLTKADKKLARMLADLRGSSRGRSAARIYGATGAGQLRQIRDADGQSQDPRGTEAFERAAPLEVAA